MRLWHKDLIRVLPKQQLISQWRECIAIAKSIQQYGSTRHGLVEKVMNYPISHLYYYTDLVVLELIERGYKVSPFALRKFEDIMGKIAYRHYDDLVNENELFEGWHDARYLAQCYYNLQEKYDCGLITEYEWRNIERQVEESYNELV